MTKRSMGSTNKLRKGTQELLERRGMAASTKPMGPDTKTNAIPGMKAGTHFGDTAFRHGGQADTTMGMQSAPAMHAELKGHRHRGAEKHSAH